MANWLECVGFPGYEVSDEGQVRKVAPWASMPANHVLSQRPNNRGYPRVRFKAGGQLRSPLVHRLVARAFIGECPAGFECNHKNLDRADPMLANLEYVRAGENIAHSHSENTQRRTPRGVTHPWAKLTAEQASAIRESPLSCAKLAARYSVTRQSVWAVKAGLTWKT